MISRPESVRSRERSPRLPSSPSIDSLATTSSPGTRRGSTEHYNNNNNNDNTQTPPPPAAPVSASASMVSINTKQDDDNDSDWDGDDILEFRVDQDSDPSVMRSSLGNESDPVVVRHLRSSPIPNPSSIEEEEPVEESRPEKQPSAASHQAQDTAFAHLRNEPLKPVEEQDWQEMVTEASYAVYDDKGKIIVHHQNASQEVEEGEDKDKGEKGYTRVTVDDDVRSVTSMDEKADYLFDDDELNRDPLKQLHATKDMLTVSQRIGYVGLCRLVIMSMAQDLSTLKASKKALKSLTISMESLSKWSQQMMIRLYSHMDISAEEQIMIEQLAEHGVLPEDLTPSLKQAAKVRNPMKDKQDEEPEEIETKEFEDFHMKDPEELDETIEIDIRWTILCDLFLVLISDSVYDSRSRTLLEKVGDQLEVTRLEIAQFEKKVTDALEIEDAGDHNHHWDETEIMEARRKKALRKKYAYVGLATLGGGLVIGLSAGLLAPVIGAGLAAGFTTVGVGGTSGFLAGAGGTALVTTAGTMAGARVGSKGMSNRMGHVQTFEYRPLHNNKRVNVIITVSGWMSGKEDDVRLPFSTVDPLMGDLVSILWEPEMLLSMGTTINILATEVLVQSIQQVLGSTVLTALMASIQLPMLLTKLSYLLDNPWNVSLDRAWSAGLIMADSLIQRHLGVRPATLVGFSLGARVIYSCLVELSRRGAYGLVQDVYIFGGPMAVKQDQFALARSVVSGRFVNAFSRKDWILGYLFRATSGGLGRVAGLAPVEIVGANVENFDCTELVDGHMGYRKSLPKLLKQVGFEVVSEEFTEIEDPDPERQREKQQELKAELDEARRQMNQEAAKLESQSNKKKLFSWFRPKRKEWWETTEGGSHMGAAEVQTQSGDVMFDLDAIQQQVDNLQTTSQVQGQVDRDAIVPGTSEADKKKETVTKQDEYEVETMEGTHPGIKLEDHS